MNRLVDKLLPGRSADALRLWGLVAVLATVSQLNEALIDATISQQVIYWGVRFTVFSASLFGAQWVADTYFDSKLQSPAWLKPVVFVSALAILPFTIVELILEANLPMVPAYDDDEFMSISPLLAYSSEYATNASIVMPLHFLVWLLVERHANASKSTQDSEFEPTPEFLQKTHGIALKDVLALKAEEHYILIYTLNGSELIHQKFGEAIKQMPAAIGLQVHRSWWVADAHVVESKRGARRWQLTLSNDTEVPVSDAYTKAARERGLLKRKTRRKETKN